MSDIKLQVVKMFDDQILSPNINLAKYKDDQYTVYFEPFCRPLPVNKNIITVQSYMGTGKTSGMLIKDIQHFIDKDPNVQKIMKMLEVADLTICASQFIADRIKNIGKAAIYIPDSVDAEHFSLRKNSQDLQISKRYCISSSEDLSFLGLSKSQGLTSLS